MTTRLETYIGMYIECDNPLITETTSIPYCSACKKGYPEECMYCSKCGRELKYSKIENGGSKNKVDLYTFMCERLGDDMYNTYDVMTEIESPFVDKDIFISNIRDAFNFSIDGFSVTGLDKKAINSCKTEFIDNRDAQEFLALCIDAYGDDSVEVKFGVINYYV
jgi:hypothetical protein